MTENSTNIQHLLSAYHLLPHKGLGQNFLSDDAVLSRIAEISEAGPDSSVLEIGPGLGTLTRHLAQRAKQVVAVELDQNLIPVLKKELKDCPNVAIVQGDILTFDPAGYLEAGYIAAGNIPYYITSAVIRRLLNQPVRPRCMTLTVQEEVADRICAADGKMSLLALGVQIYGKPTVEMKISRDSFYPVPDVDSAVVKIALFDQPLVPDDRAEDFFKLAKAGFGQKRKTLRNSLSSDLHLTPAAAEEALRRAEIDPTRRAETLKISEWVRLMKEFDLK